MVELIVAVTVLVCVLGPAALIYRRLSAPTTLPVTAAWIDELSVDRYEPMRRLLAQDDLRVLRADPSFTPRKAAEFRRKRARIFYSYLRSLHQDFQRVCMTLKIVMVQSRDDRPDLAAVLIRSQRAFVLGLMFVHCRVLFYRWGMGTVDVAGLLKRFDGARLELRSLIPTELTMAA